jgi:hypothetical protein
MRLVQLDQGDMRRVALVKESELHFIDGFASVYALAAAAIAGDGNLTNLVMKHLDERLSYDLVYSGSSAWKLLPPIDHPDEPSRCLVSGTGLTHLGSARDRQSMHENVSTENETDSMKMFRWGIEAGRPAPAAVGVAPEWFYKGNGTVVQRPGDPLVVPPFAEDGGEEAEIAIAYLISHDGRPYRIGMMPGNEFSDHRFEKKNYLNLAGSKLRTCSIGPELTVNPQFDTVIGNVAIERSGSILWTQPIASGEAEMCHNLRNLEHHHFKFPLHRRPGDVHIHFLGAHSLSFGRGVELEDGDVMEVCFEGLGRPLRNPVKISKEANLPIEVSPLV